MGKSLEIINKKTATPFCLCFLCMLQYTVLGLERHLCFFTAQNRKVVMLCNVVFLKEMKVAGDVRWRSEGKCSHNLKKHMHYPPRPIMCPH